MAVKRIPMPPTTYLHECFDCSGGALVWRVRPDHHFASPAAAKTWNRRFAGRAAGKLLPNGYLHVHLTCAGRALRLYAHRIVHFLATGEQPPDVDHKNLSKGDNQSHNLRSATRQQNRRNSRSRNGLPKGVHWDRTRGKFCAQVCIDRKTINLGRFESASAAHEAYRKFAEPIYGEFFRAG